MERSPPVSPKDTFITSHFGETSFNLIMPVPLSKLCQYPTSSFDPKLFAACVWKGASGSSKKITKIQQ